MKYILLLFIFCSSVASAQNNYYQAPEYFTTQQGLSSSKVSCIAMDDRGFIWIGTGDGLNKYDGYSFTVYKMKNNDSTSILSNQIMSLYSDSRRCLWIGTSKGLQYYDPLSDAFVKMQFDQPDEVVNGHCGSIFEDSRGDMWFVFSDIGVLKYSIDTKKSYLFSPSNTQPEKSVSSRFIRSIEEDKQGNIWFGTQDNGISILDPKTNIFSHLNTENSSLPVNEVFSLKNLDNGDMLIATIGMGVGLFNRETGKIIFTNSKKYNQENAGNNYSSYCVFKTSNGKLIAGTEGQGVKEIDPLTGALRDFSIFKEHKQNIGDSKVHFIFEDKSDNLWVGLHNNGLCVFRRNITGLRTFRKIYDEPNSLSFGHVLNITTDASRNIWFATDGGGLNRYHQSTGRYYHYRYNPKQPHSLPDDAVVSVFCDSKDRIWAGTYTGGLCRYVPSTDQFVIYRHDPENENSLPDNFVNSIVEDRNGQLWIGTNKGGLSCLNPESGYFINYSTDKNEDLVSNCIKLLFIDRKGKLWIGSHFGLSNYDMHTGKFVNYSDDPAISNSAVFAITEDDKGQLWIGGSYGLLLFDAKEDRFVRHYPEDDDFSTIINGIVPSGEQLWLSTNKDIICYIPATENVHWISQNIELTHEFLPTSYYKSPNGEIFFGANEGCYSFFPWYLQMKIYTPEVYLTKLKIFDKQVMPNKPFDGKVILSKDMSYTDKIVLQHSQKSFTLEFTAPDTPFPNSTMFACRMDGFDNDWVVYNSNQRSVTYTNFQPGVYKFNVQASNTPEVWSGHETRLTIEILTPVWATWWAKLCYFIIVSTVLFLISRLVYTRIKDKNELRIERLKVKQQEELSQSKMQFFTNISHEFRTPLTLILGPLEQMHSVEKDPERNQLYQIMLWNANRLLLLINQILDLRKAEKGKMKITVQQIELVSFVKDRLGMFTEMAKRKKISLSYNYYVNNIIVWFDPDMLEKCLYNLLSNAFKCTSEGGKIQVAIKQAEDGRMSLSVSDTGYGMTAKEQTYIFDRFYQGKQNSYQTGSGIGLHFTKSIVEQHKGSIQVESVEGKGSCFTILIKPGNSHFSPDDISWTPLLKSEPEEIINDADTSPKQGEESKPYILLVEDEEDMRLYIRKELEPDYIITEAVNGREALNSLLQKTPDLIITDVMMPEMDGMELCRIVKEGIDTCHIPIIMLTALGDTDHKMEGLETGADSYIPKPFHSRHLRIRIEKLLELRRKLKERFGRILNVDAKEVDVCDADEVFVKNAVEYIRLHIANPELSVDELSKAMNMSRTNLHRRLKTTTGLSPIDLIKTIRMKQAAYLLSTGNLNVSEVAYKVGYNAPSYFSSSFSAYFNISPTAYLKQNTQQT